MRPKTQRAYNWRQVVGRMWGVGETGKEGVWGGVLGDLDGIWTT